MLKNYICLLYSILDSISHYFIILASVMNVVTWNVFQLTAEPRQKVTSGILAVLCRGYDIVQ